MTDEIAGMKITINDSLPPNVIGIVSVTGAQLLRENVALRAELAQARDGWKDAVRLWGIDKAELAQARQRIDEMESKLSGTCEWTEIDDVNQLYWSGSCGLDWSLGDGTPSENEMIYCPKCGRKIAQAPAGPEVENA